jgi:hypothetical protein
MSPIGIEELISFWNNETSNVHKDDREAMSVRRSVPPEVNSPSSFFESTSTTHENHFHLSLSPAPYMGNLRTADIFLLMINPTVGYSDYCTDSDQRFRAALARTREQDFKEGELGCLALNPEFCSSSWFYYYERLFSTILWKYASIKAVTYLRALQELSRRLAILELVPYYSKSAGQINKKFVGGLPSARKAIKAAKELQVKATHEDATVIVRWKGNIWEFENTDGITQAIARNGLGFAREAVLKRLLKH